MLRRRKLTLLAACAALSIPYVASAATVASVSGSVLVSKGAGFAPIKGDTELAAGGHVLVQPGSLALISYPGDCVVRVGTGVWQVQPTAPCAKGTREIDFTNRMNDGMGPGNGRDAGYGAGVGYGGGAGFAGFDPGNALFIDPGNALFVGGIVVGSGLLIGCAVDWCQSKKTSP
jgi:hypothetical protein